MSMFRVFSSVLVMAVLVLTGCEDCDDPETIIITNNVYAVTLPPPIPSTSSSRVVPPEEVTLPIEPEITVYTMTIINTTGYPLETAVNGEGQSIAANGSASWSLMSPAVVVQINGHPDFLGWNHTWLMSAQSETVIVSVADIQN